MSETTYGSDIAVRSLEALGLHIAAFNPGASFRGLHESMVHHGVPEAVLCLSETVAVAVAHGYAKATGRPMAVFLHDLVGLQAASMAIFNAWVDQVPMLVLGGGGPTTHTGRRPWIDWIHTSRAQADIVADHVRWHGAPTSIASVPEVLHRAVRAAVTAPHGPSYVSLDAEIQEGEATAEDAASLSLLGAVDAPRSTLPAPQTEELATTLLGADRPVIVADRVGRSREGYRALATIAELLQAPVVDLGSRHNFSNRHPLDGTTSRTSLLRGADLVLALDCRDVDFALSDVDLRTRQATALAPDARIVSISLSEAVSTGFLELERSVPGRETILADTAQLLPELAEALARHRPGTPAAPSGARAPEQLRGTVPSAHIDRDLLSAEVWRAVRTGPWQLANGARTLPVRRHWDLDRFGAHLGTSGGAGLGYGIGATLGAALANRATDTLTVDLQADGDLLYTVSGLWTASNLRLPILFVVVNNRCYGQDLRHQLAMATERGRPAAHAHVGIDIDDPAIDVRALAEAQGVEATGPLTDPRELRTALERSVRIARQERRPVLLDVLVDH